MALKHFEDEIVQNVRQTPVATTGHERDNLRALWNSTGLCDFVTLARAVIDCHVTS